MTSSRSTALLLALAALAAPLAAATPREKVDPWIEEQLSLSAPGAKVGVLIELAERADLSGIRGTKAEKGAAVYRALVETSARTQAPLLKRLRELAVTYRTFWIANFVRVNADEALVAELAGRDDVLRLSGDSPIRVPEPPELSAPTTLEAPAAVEWNVSKVNADDVWTLGYRGQSAVVAGQDTGYQWNHPALQGKYRGWNGASADHNYNWHDAIHSDIGGAGPNSCGRNLTAPCDDQSHGTHTMGTMVGDDGAGNQVGLAPGAKWVGCRNMDEGDGTPTTYIECFQWLLAPTDLADANPDPTRAPDVINNSWGCPISEGCNTGNFATMNTVVANLRAAGIAVVSSAGNSGSAGCGTVNTPAAIFDAAITVAAVDSSDAVASFSSRGPVTVDGSNRPKPDISAPGVCIRSSVPINGWGSCWDGTSMAGPHVAAAVALLISAQPALRGDVDTIEALLEAGALPRTTAQGCGGDTASQVPNNVYGWGRLDVLAAVEDALALDLLTVDDFELGTLLRWDLACPGGPGCS